MAAVLGDFADARAGLFGVAPDEDHGGAGFGEGTGDGPAQYSSAADDDGHFFTQ